MTTERDAWDGRQRDREFGRLAATPSPVLSALARMPKEVAPLSLCYRERRRLDRISAALRASDPGLAALLAVFEVLEAGQPMPRWEQQRRRLLSRIGSTLLWTISVIISLIIRAARTCRNRLRTRRPRRPMRDMPHVKPGGSGTAHRVRGDD